MITDIRSDGTIAYKIDLGDDFTELRKSRRAAAASFWKIKKAKFNHLQQIKMVIPRDYYANYDNLPHEQ